jgi:hypothetical protein
MQEVEATDELRRILALPRRDPVAPEGLAAELTEILAVRDRCPGAVLPPRADGICTVCDHPMVLRPLQALALHDIGICGGAFLPLDLGEGKSLVSFLAPWVLDAGRVILLERASLLKKTALERDALMRHWLIPNHIRLMSYQMLGLVQSASELDLFFRQDRADRAERPDLIIADETQALKNRDAAVTRRVERHMKKYPDTRFVGMTGTIMRKSICDFAHIVRWALKDGAPVPRKDSEVDEWALALDDRIENEFMRVEPGALLQFANPEEIRLYGELKAARLGFQRRLRETPGIVPSATTGAKVDVGLTIRSLRYDVSMTSTEYFSELREGRTPDGYDIMEATDVWRHERELALGFYQVWDPAPPEEWRAARRAWYSFVRMVRSRSHTLDSPKQVEMACDAAAAGDVRMTDTLAVGIGILAKWRAIEPTFKPNPIAVWHDDSALRVAAKWMSAEPGIVWVEHIPFGQRLATMTGTKYYGPDGLAPDGEFIDHADPKRCVIASVKANKEGRNLQLKWRRNLITTMCEGADLIHQVIGRTHRSRQTRDVLVDVFLGCRAHANAWEKATSSASSIVDTVGTQNKLLVAKIEWPSDDEIASWSGPRWNN